MNSNIVNINATNISRRREAAVNEIKGLLSKMSLSELVRINNGISDKPEDRIYDLKNASDVHDLLNVINLDKRKLLRGFGISDELDYISKNFRRDSKYKSGFSKPVEKIDTRGLAKWLVYSAYETGLLTVGNPETDGRLKEIYCNRVNKGIEKGSIEEKRLIRDITAFLDGLPLYDAIPYHNDLLEVSSSYYMLNDNVYLSIDLDDDYIDDLISDYYENNLTGFIKNIGGKCDSRYIVLKLDEQGLFITVDSFSEADIRSLAEKIVSTKVSGSFYKDNRISTIVYGIGDDIQKVAEDTYFYTKVDELCVQQNIDKEKLIFHEENLKCSGCCRELSVYSPDVNKTFAMFYNSGDDVRIENLRMNGEKSHIDMSSGEFKVIALNGDVVVDMSERKTFHRNTNMSYDINRKICEIDYDDVLRCTS